MKRNLIYTLCAAALLGLGGCEKDLSTNDPTGNPTPDANGMVTFDLAVTTGGYEDGVPETRAGQAPYTFVHDLGDGYVMTSTLTPQPKTRAGESQQVLADGTTVFMVAFASTDTQGATPLGYELLSVLYGKIAISLPAGQTFNLAFISYNDQTVFKPEDFIAWTGEATTTNRHYYALPPGATLRNWTDGDETHHLPMVMKTNTDSIPADYVVSRLANYPPTGTVTAMPIHFKRAFAQLKWVLNVNPNVYHEYVGDLDAGFYKKYQKAWTRLANVANGAAFTGSTDQSTYPWSGYAAAELPAGSFFQHTHNDAEPITSFEDSTTFIPFPTYSSAAGANQSAQIYINSMTIKNPAGDKVVTNVELPILYGEGQNMIFKPGCSYTVTSNVTKRIQWAASNIYWNGTTLTFDETPQDHDGDETTYESGLIPGLFFKWGSLIGISKASRRVYVPSTQAYGAYQQEQLSASGLWSSISYIPSNYLVDGMIPTDGQAIEGAVIENDIYNWHGDICAYITNGLWRIPNPKEFNMHGPLHTYQDLSTVVPTIGWYSPGANETWSWDHFDTTTYQDGPVPIPYTNQVVRLVTSTGETVQFPATAIMTTWGSSGGASGYWSNIEYDQYYGTSLYFDSRRAYLEHNSGDSKAEAYSIRCVKKSN